MSYSIQKTSQLKYTIVLNALYTAILSALGLFTMWITSRQIYIYEILKQPYPEFDPPLILLGILLTVFFLVPAVILLWITLRVNKLDNTGRKLNLLILPFCILLTFPIGLILIPFQFYTLVKHKETRKLFS